jgi:hypothetical protein
VNPESTGVPPVSTTVTAMSPSSEKALTTLPGTVAVAIASQASV